MAYVYADMDALSEYQKKIVQTISLLEDQAKCKQDLVEKTKGKIHNAIERAEAAESIAQAALYNAQEQLSNAERVTREYNSHLQADQEPVTTPEYYYERVADCEAEHAYAKATCRQTQDTLDKFEEYVRSYESAQEAGLEAIRKLLRKSGIFFVAYIQKLVQAKRCTLFSEANNSPASQTTRPSKTDAPTPNDNIETWGKADSTSGWCPNHHMTAVHIASNGTKSVSLQIDGKDYVFPCTLKGMEEAYNHATQSDDSEMICRTYTMFEIEVLRDSLDLTNGDPNYPQLGGYHKDVEPNDPPGFESHHIPAQSVQAPDKSILPTVSISKDDHKSTSSYTGKQAKKYNSFIPSRIPALKYKESMSSLIQKGCSGYVEAVRDELLDLRSQTGHRYDGGISGFLDAVIDMIAVSGIPQAIF